MSDNTEFFNIPNLTSDSSLEQDFKNICISLNERGYSITNQLVGYLLSRDPSYITNYRDARKTIQKYDVDQLLDFLVTYYLEKEGF